MLIVLVGCECTAMLKVECGPDNKGRLHGGRNVSV